MTAIFFFVVKPPVSIVSTLMLSSATNKIYVESKTDRLFGRNSKLE